MTSMFSSSNRALMMARPPGSTSARSSLMPGSSAGMTRPDRMMRSFSLARPARVMPRVEKPHSVRMAYSALAVPDEP
ncbi:Uncharacterised protein [Bordetella pertussis]|nr:Uncharacterised protein [Bordetella pertussis]